MLYHGGILFGRATDDPQSLAKTVLGVMISLLDPLLFRKCCPLQNSPFLYEQIRLTINAISQLLGIVKAVICDGNINNQAFPRLFDTDPEQPWLTNGGIYLLYDFVHLLKNIRNNWLTEKMEELAFYERGMKKVASWSHLVELYKLEAEGLVKMSKLTEVSVYPKPIERQSVATCLRGILRRDLHCYH